MEGLLSTGPTPSSFYQAIFIQLLEGSASQLIASARGAFCPGFFGPLVLQKIPFFYICFVLQFSVDISKF